MKTYFYVIRDGEVFEGPIATREGAKSFVSLFKKYDKHNNEKHIYEIDEATATLINPS